MTLPFSDAEKVKAHADVMEVEHIEFFDAAHKYTVEADEIVEVQLTFIDQEKFRLTVDEFDKLHEYQFKLRPTENNS